ncbi:MAG TPA: ABC transporter permease [Aggregatilineaceae bacterium]|nr:ABC transporter permease [Aggregatilineaceae bacterium]
MATEVSFADHRRRLGRRRAFIGIAREYVGRSPEAGAIFGFVAVFLFFFFATWANTGWPPQITTATSVLSVFNKATAHGIIAVGVTMLMISGEFDLSVGSILGLSALFFIIAASRGLGGLVEVLPGIDQARVEQWGISYQGLPGIICILIALAIGAFLGMINGLLLITTRIPSFIVTLGTLYFYRSIMVSIIPGGTIARYTREPMVWYFHPLIIIGFCFLAVLTVAFFLWPSIQGSWMRLQLAQQGNRKVGPILRLILIGLLLLAIFSLSVVISLGYTDRLDKLIGAPFFDILNGQFAFTTENFRSGTIWWFLIAIVFHFILNNTRYGNAIFATGGNPQAARAQGINVNRVKLSVFVLSGMLAATAGIMEAARFKVVEPLRGTGYELDVIAATVIGGTLLTGGYGSIIGSVLGVLIAFMLSTGLVLINVPAEWFRGILGLIMIGAVIINTNIRRQR